MIIADKWEDYKIIDMAEGQKLEKWGDIILSRPDPQIIWKNKSYPKRWDELYAIYRRSNKGGGNWEYKKRLPQNWEIKYKDLVFNMDNIHQFIQMAVPIIISELGQLEIITNKD